MNGVNYDTVILGATFFGLGAALALPGKTLIVEPGGSMGDDFVASLHEKGAFGAPLYTDAGTAFYRDLEKRGAASSEGWVYAAPALYVLSSYLEKGGIFPLPLTRVLHILKKEKGFEIRLYGSRGFFSVYAKRILDTTPFRLGKSPLKPTALEKSLYAIVKLEQERQMDKILYNPLSKLHYVKVPLLAEDNWYDARQKLRFAYQNLMTNEKLRISFIATAFAYNGDSKQDAVVEDEWEWIPSCSYHHPIEAYDQGVLWAKEVK